MPTLGLEVTVACCALAPQIIRGLVDGGTLAVTSHDLLPVCGLVGPGRGLRAVLGVNECTHDLLAVARPGVTARGHTGPATGHVTRRRSRDSSPSADRSRSRKRSWRPGRSHWDRAEAAVASRDRGDYGLTVAPAPAVAGGTTTLPTSSGAAVGRLLLVQPLRPLRPVNVSMLRSLSALSTGRERSRSGGKRGRGRSLLTLPFRPVLLPPPPPLESLVSERGLVCCLLPPPVILVQAVVALGVPAQSLAAPAPLCPVPRCWARMCELRRVLTDLDRDDSFRSVLRLIQEFHGMEELASVTYNRCKTSLALIYRLQSESSPALHLPLSPLLGSLLEDTNLALAKFVEDQTVHGFLPVPGRRHRRYYRTSSSSFPGPYTVPPGLASITLDKVSESKKRSVSLSHSQASSLETVVSSVCEVTSWLDWWLSTCGGLREHLPNEVWQLREVDALWVESLGVPGCPGGHGSWQSRVIALRFPACGCLVYGPG